MPLVVKLGGSLHASPLRAQWIAALADYPGAMTLVCGGGPFADAVRAAQPVMRYGDKAGHAMAVLAMEQYALALASLHDGLELAATREEICAAHNCGRIALWRPSLMVSAARDIAPAWQVTSDSLAAWLARQLDAKALLLIKSLDVDADIDLTALAAAGIVDPAFPDYVGSTPVYIAGPKELRDARRLLSCGASPGVRIGADMRKTA